VSTTGSADSPTTTTPDDPTPNAPGSALQTGFFRPRPSPVPRRSATPDVTEDGAPEDATTPDCMAGPDGTQNAATAAEADAAGGPDEAENAATGTKAAAGLAEPRADSSADTVIVGAPVRAGTPDHPATLPALAPATLPAAFVPIAPAPVAAEPPAYPEPQRSYPVKQRKGWRKLLRRS
jgi:hypothetical protein